MQDVAAIFFHFNIEPLARICARERNTAFSINSDCAHAVGIPTKMDRLSRNLNTLALALAESKGVKKWSERQDSNLRRLAPKASALARLSYAPTRRPNIAKDPHSATTICDYSPQNTIINLNLAVTRAKPECGRPPFLLDGGPPNASFIQLCRYKLLPGP